VTSATAGSRATTPRKALSPAPWLFIIVLIAAGCASGHHTTAPTTTAPVTATTTAETPTTTETERLQPVVVQLTDLPTGWQDSATGGVNEGDSDDEYELAQCLGAPSTAADQLVEIDSDEYSLDSQPLATVDSSVIGYKSAADVAAGVAVLRDPGLASCAQQALPDDLSGILPTAAKIENFAIRVSLGPGAGPADVVATVTSSFVVTGLGRAEDFAADFVFLTGATDEVELIFVAPSPGVPETVRSMVIAEVSARIGED
jgi:hypothetical protein